MRTRKMKRWLSIILAGLAAVILIAAAGGAFLFRHELKTLHSLKKVDDNVLYTMKYDGDYGFDEFLETGASSDSELVEFVTNRLLKGIPLEFSIPDLGCSTFSAQTEDGARIFGRNFDLTYSPAMFVLTEPANGYRSMSTVNLAFLGFGEDKLPDTLKRKIITLAAPYAPLDGVNEKGLAVAVLRIGDEPTNQDTGKTDITTTTAIRLMLDKAANVDEALELLAQYDMHSSAGSCYHFQLADALGNSAVAEYIDNEFEVIGKKEITRLQRISCCQRRNLILEMVRTVIRYWNRHWENVPALLGMSRRLWTCWKLRLRTGMCLRQQDVLMPHSGPLYIIARTLQPVWLPGGSMTSLPMNSVLNSNLFFCGEQSLDCLSAVVFWKVFMEYNISGNFPGFQIIIQPPFYNTAQGNCVLAGRIGHCEDNMGLQGIVLKNNSGFLYLSQGVQGIFYFYS